ncbi:MAG: 16S rRNA (cytidine(1402)-2'-O)-methyltransferase, partial [Chloroflexota bacterium]|nr:16S rRNA (cytidine(1402)-2'-O)-methyltransferase [Chloroflexota bacterium]
PFRIEALLRDALEVYGDRPAALARELTKLHETVDRGTISSLMRGVSSGKAKGEYVVVIAGAERSPRGDLTGADADEEAGGNLDPDEDEVLSSMG